ncbi:hypothetical protein GSI_03050 [Ganoderma sinense ZZ0214-1]|uniref:Uncharacterized protein n=1 Tax=Ganoderma sinense ZZ0214-1 TaxID=1077348 RepID=A0A2G8SKH8_9APHY|nr:hypothetical protein GSI_03050 [Ganoderma sinense ZZ0214-1]
MSVPEAGTARSAPRFSLLFTPADGKAYNSKDRDLVFAQQPLENPKLPGYLFPSPTSRIKPPELKYGWRLGEEQFLSLIHTHFTDAIRYCIGPGLDDDGNEPDLPPEEFLRPHINTDATLFGLHIVDSILRYLGVKVTDANRALIDVDYLCDSQGRPDVGLAVGSTHTGLILLEPHLSKLKALVSPNEDAKWYLGFDNWEWSRQVPKQVPKHKAKKSTATTALRVTTAS